MTFFINIGDPSSSVDTFLGTDLSKCFASKRRIPITTNQVKMFNRSFYLNSLHLICILQVREQSTTQLTYCRLLSGVFQLYCVTLCLVVGSKRTVQSMGTKIRLMECKSRFIQRANSIGRASGRVLDQISVVSWTNWLINVSFFFPQLQRWHPAPIIIRIFSNISSLVIWEQGRVVSCISLPRRNVSFDSYSEVCTGASQV